MNLFLVWILTPNVIAARFSRYFVVQWGVVADRTTDSVQYAQNGTGVPATYRYLVPM